MLRARSARPSASERGVRTRPALPDARKAREVGRHAPRAQRAAERQRAGGEDPSGFAGRGGGGGAPPEGGGGEDAPARGGGGGGGGDPPPIKDVLDLEADVVPVAHGTELLR